MSLNLSLTWLGHSAFHLRPHSGPEILIDPWLNNPLAPGNTTELAERATLVLLTHAHSDHFDGVAELVKRTGATVVSQYEIDAELGSQGVPPDQRMGPNHGGTVEVQAVKVTLVQAFHSSSSFESNGRARSIGTPSGMVIELPGGPVIYNTGDTAVFGDMRLISELYHPDILMLPIGDFYTMGPRQAAKACELVNPRWIIPQHYGTFPALTGTPAALRELLPIHLRDRLLAPAPGETIA